QVHDLFLVLDLEATCTKRRDLFPVEIIEVSAVLMDAHTLVRQGEFQSYVRPTEHPTLDPFCTELTGISQDQVDTAPLLGSVLPRLAEWLRGLGALQEGEGAGEAASLLPVTWTDWDLKVCLETECEWRKLPRPPYLRRWCNLKRVYTGRYRRTNSLQKCVEALGLTWQGRAHSGLDDSRNTAALAARMVRDGCVLRVTDSFREAQRGAAQQEPQERQEGQAGGSGAGAGSGGGGGGKGNGGGGNGKGRSGSGGLRQSVLTLSPAPAAPETAAAAGPGSPASATAGSGAAAGVTLRATLAPPAGDAASALYDGSGRWLGRCRCGVAAHFRTTKKPGANLGRQFYSCGRWAIADRSRHCDFFLWADQAGGGAAAAVAAAGGAAVAGGGAGPSRRKS
ncbi:ERI1 exoribonuclease 2, partial [Tetrabaena socialis]